MAYPGGLDQMNGPDHPDVLRFHAYGLMVVCLLLLLRAIFNIRIVKNLFFFFFEK